MTKPIQSDEDMLAEIDFSGGVRGLFYRPGARLNLPAYTHAAEEDVRETLEGEAECDAGKVFPHAQVMAEVRAIIGKRTFNRLPEAG